MLHHSPQNISRLLIGNDLLVFIQEQLLGLRDARRIR